MKMINIADIDECSEGTDNCNANAACYNYIGSFICFCYPGYIGTGVMCVGEYVE